MLFVAVDESWKNIFLGCNVVLQVFNDTEIADDDLDVLEVLYEVNNFFVKCIDIELRKEWIIVRISI